ncbi:MAG: hypothetical protein ACTSSI_18410 [Candidatus Helarchaeota archaeon]
MNKRFEAMDRRFEALQEEMNKRFEAMDKRFEAMQEEMNKRFEAMDKRFEAMDRRFTGLDKKLDKLLAAFGKPFEQFGRNIVLNILKAEGMEDVKIEPLKLRNPKREILDINELEIDGFSESPPIIVEITSILSDIKKIDKFLKKKSIMEKIHAKTFRGFFVAASTELTPDEKARVIAMLTKEKTTLINL